MIYTLLTNKAMRTAYAAHAGQVDKCGVPYIFHPIHLAEQMPDEISVCAALLHDVAEDTDITLSELESEFPSAVIDVLKLLTHKDGIDYFDYIRAIRSNPTAVRVKLADIAHNSDETRYAGCSEIDAEQLAARRAKYKKAKALVTMGMPMSVLKEDNIFEKIIAIKYDVPNDKPEMFDDYKKAVDIFYDKVLEKNG